MRKFSEKLQEVLCEDWFNDNIILSMAGVGIVDNGSIIEGFDCEIDDENMFIRDNHNREIILELNIIKSIDYDEDMCGNTISITLNNESVINLTSTTM